MSDKLVKLLSKVLNAYNIPVSYHTIENVITTHPEYPSIQCISDAFDKWRIKHFAIVYP